MLDSDMYVPPEEILWQGSCHVKVPSKDRTGIAEQISAWKQNLVLLRRPQREQGPLRLILYHSNDVTCRVNFFNPTVFFLYKDSVVGLRFSAKIHKHEFVVVIDVSDDESGRPQQGQPGILRRLKFRGTYSPLRETSDAEAAHPSKPLLFIAPHMGDYLAAMQFMTVIRDVLSPPSHAVQASLDPARTFDVSFLDAPQSPLPGHYKYMYGLLTIEQGERGYVVTLRDKERGTELFSWCVNMIRQFLVLETEKPRDKDTVLRVLTDKSHPLGDRPIRFYCTEARRLRQALLDASMAHRQLGIHHGAPMRQD